MKKKSVKRATPRGMFQELYGGPVTDSAAQDRVFDSLRRERRLQDHLFGEQANRSIGDFIIIAEEYLNRAKRAAVQGPLDAAIDRLSPLLPLRRKASPLILLKKVAAVLVKCLEQHGDL